MSYIEAEGILLNANMKKGGKLLLQIEISEDLDNKEDYFHLRKMIEKNVRFSLESTIVSYKVEINAKTNKPIREYKVDSMGIVSEVSKPEGEQLEVDLGLPKENVPVKEEKAEADLLVIDEFIRSGLAPIYDDMTYDFPHILSRIANDGVTYAKIAYELNISLGEFSVIIDEYRKRVAPLAIKWNEWRQGHTETPETVVVKDPEDKAAASDNDEKQGDAGESQNKTDDQSDDSSKSGENDPTLANELGDSQGDKSTTTNNEPDLAAVDNYILENKPSFDDIPFDFPSLVKRRKEGETWLEIAQSEKVSSSTLQSNLSKYRKKVKEAMKGQSGAA